MPDEKTVNLSVRLFVLCTERMILSVWIFQMDTLYNTSRKHLTYFQRFVYTIGGLIYVSMQEIPENTGITQCCITSGQIRTLLLGTYLYSWPTHTALASSLRRKLSNIQTTESSGRSPWCPNYNLQWKN